MKTKRPYQYTECGLDNVYLVNGFEPVETPRGKGVHIENMQGLHRAIGRFLLEERKHLSGKELRFLRHELNMTQEDLCLLVGVDVQTIARWEKGHCEVAPPADRLIRAIYKEATHGNLNIIEPLKRLAELDEILHGEDGEQLWLEEVADHWQQAEERTAA
jgi:putative transcriptional regulator